MLRLSSGCGDDRAPADTAAGGVIEPRSTTTQGEAGGAGQGGDAAAGGVSGAAGASAVGHPAVLGEAIGRPCEVAADCPGGLVCLNALSDRFDAGSPPGGLCTLGCAESTSECSALGAHCVDFGEAAYCMQTCEFGVGSKCHARQDFACEPSYRAVDVRCDVDGDCGANALCRGQSCYLVRPLCLPRCNGAADCPSSSYCDPVSGECVREAPTGDPAGAACDPSNETETCRGICLGSVTSSVARCTEFCTLGNTSACGPGAACLLTLASAQYSAAPGDQGACAPLCDCDNLCPAGLSCLTLTAAIEGRSGYCAEASDGQAVLDCGNAGTGSGAAGAASSGAP